MKNSKYYFFILLQFITISITGCKDKEAEYEIYENHGIPVCGIEDPLVNIDWLAEFTAENTPPTKSPPFYGFNIYIQLYLNNETQENYIVILFDFIEKGEPYEFEPIDEYSLKQIYSCSGERLFIDSAGNTESDAWYDFFYSGKNTSQGIIWSRKEIF